VVTRKTMCKSRIIVCLNQSPTCWSTLFICW